MRHFICTIHFIHKIGDDLHRLMSKKKEVPDLRNKGRNTHTHTHTEITFNVQPTIISKNN